MGSWYQTSEEHDQHQPSQLLHLARPASTMMEIFATGGLILLVVGIFSWCFVRFYKKKRSPKETRGKKHQKGPIDIKIVERLGKTYTEKVAEDEKELLQNEEDGLDVKKKKKYQ